MRESGLAGWRQQMFTAGQKVLVEDVPNLLLSALTARLQAQLAEFEPLLEHLQEGVLFGQQGQPALLIAMLVRIDAAGDQLASFVASGSGFFEGNLGISA